MSMHVVAWKQARPRRLRAGHWGPDTRSPALPPPEDLLPRRRGQQKVAASGPHAARHSPPRLPPRGGSRGSGGSWFGLRKVGLPVQKPVNVAVKPGAGPRCGSPARACHGHGAGPACSPSGKAAPPRGRPRSLSSRGTCLAQGLSSFLHCYLAAQLVLPKAGRAGWGEGGRVPNAEGRRGSAAVLILTRCFCVSVCLRFRRPSDVLS